MYMEYEEYENVSTYPGGVCLVLKTISSVEVDPGDVTLYDAVKSSCPGVEHGGEWYPAAELRFLSVYDGDVVQIYNDADGDFLFELIRA